MTLDTVHNYKGWLHNSQKRANGEAKYAFTMATANLMLPKWLKQN